MKHQKGRKKGRAVPAVESGTPSAETDASLVADSATDDERDRYVGSFPIVGVGASAGGLEAFMQLLKHLPGDTGMGFVLVQHLDPQHESALTQILTRVTSLPVQEITDHQVVEANHVYVIPPDTDLTIQRGVLKLQPRTRERVPHRPIDVFFESLAQDQRECAIGVVLSGTANDGTLGLEAIKAEGGITFAQDDSARHDSMPRSAVAAGCVDMVLAPADIAKELTRIAQHPYVGGPPLEPSRTAEGDAAAATAHEDDDTPLPSGGKVPAGRRPARSATKTAGGGRAVQDGYKRILLLLRNHAGVDFSLYKSTTIRRRITRRLVLNKHDTLEDYAEFLRGNSRELDALYTDVLISVTSFFRNPEVFDLLERTVFPKVLQTRGDDPIRVWVLGCSTGQEAYSIAIAFVEAAERAPRARTLQVFATDLNEALLEKARHGLYAKTLAGDISPERLRRFFVEEQGGYRVSKSLREMVVFARQNLIDDPPFSRMDLISCRNLLIYLEPSMQKRALPTFHYALKSEGFLLLGPSESIGGFTDFFEPVDKKSKLYSKKPGPTPGFHLPATKEHGERPAPGRRVPLSRVHRGAEDFGAELDAQREADRLTVHQFSPPGVLVNSALQVLQFRGPTGAYLQPPAGKATFDVLKMAREGLVVPLRSALNRAKKDNKTARRDAIRVKQDGKTRTVNVQVIPLKNLRAPCFLVLFEDTGKAERLAARAAGGAEWTAARPPRTGKRESARVAELETELSETRDYLQSVQEQHEAANEELQAANEEVQSANEELQSINEELETSKEELESANEELTTVNEEMSNRNVELSRLNSDLVNLQNSTKLAIVLLGRDLTIRRFSPQAEKQFDLLAADVGRPIGHIRHNLVLDNAAAGPLDLEALGADVIAGVREEERTVLDANGRWHSLRVRPYMTLDNKVDGAVLVLTDIDTLKRSELSIAAARDYAENTVEAVREPLLVLDKNLRVETVNRAFYRTFRVASAETIGTVIYDLGNRQWDIPRLRELLQRIMVEKTSIDDFEVTHDFEHVGRRTMLLNARRIDDPARNTQRILLAIGDITERVRQQADLRHSESRYRRLFEAAQDGVLIVDPRTQKIVDANPVMTELLGHTRDEFLGKELFEVGLLKDEAASHAVFEELQRTGFVRHADLPLRDKAGKDREVEVVSNRYDEDGESIIQCNIRDVSERQELLRIAERARVEAEDVGDLLLRVQRITDMALLKLSFDDFLHEVLERVRATVGGEAAVILLRNLQEDEEEADEEEVLRARAAIGLTDEMREAIRVPIGQGIAGRIAVEQKPVVVDELDYSEVVSPYFRELGVRSLVGVPLLTEGGFLGVLHVGSVEPRKFGRKDAEILMLAAERIAHAVEVAARRESEHRARTAADAANRAKDEFLALLSHELRNPLSAVRNAVTSARLDPSTRERALEIAGRQSEHLTRLVDDLLDVARITQGKIRLRREPVVLHEAVQRALDSTRVLIEGRGHVVSVSCDGAVAVSADPARLEQIIGNLLTNAAKYTPPGGRIEISCERCGDEAVLRVRDNGIGVAEEMLPRVFDLFMQEDVSLGRTQGGLGIGLTVVRRLVELHGGRIEAESEGAGRGAEFIVRLPALPAAEEDPGPPEAPQAVPSARVLVVEDNRDAAESLRMLLEFFGHRIRLAPDGPAALEAVRVEVPDIALVDIGLPGMDGYEVVRRLREQPGMEGVTLVALTGYGRDEDTERALAAGFHHHLTKPIDVDRLQALMSELEVAKASS